MFLHADLLWLNVNCEYVDMCECLFYLLWFWIVSMLICVNAYFIYCDCRFWIVKMWIYVFACWFIANVNCEYVDMCECLFYLLWL
jgi:hypothetical protein